MSEGQNHKILKNKIAEKYKTKGCKTEIEYRLPNNKRIDVYIEKNGEKIGVEIGTLHGENRIEKLKEHLDRVIHLPQLGKNYKSSNYTSSKFMRRISVTIEDDQYEWLKNSPYNMSALFRDKIEEEMDEDGG